MEVFPKAGLAGFSGCAARARPAEAYPLSFSAPKNQGKVFAVCISAQAQSNTIAVADLNGDGKLDIVAPAFDLDPNHD